MNKTTVYGNGHFFKIVLNNTPNSPLPPDPTAQAVFGWVFGVFFQTILKQCPFPYAGFSKLHICRLFKVSGFAEGRRMPHNAKCKCLVAGTWCQVQVPGTWYHAPGTKHWVPGASKILGPRCPGAWYKVTGTAASSTRHPEYLVPGACA